MAKLKVVVENRLALLPARAEGGAADGNCRCSSRTTTFQVKNLGFARLRGGGRLCYVRVCGVNAGPNLFVSLGRQGAAGPGNDLVVKLTW